MKGKLIIFSAPSGSGKTTIVKHLLEQYPDLRFSISATSRLPRGNEIDGKDYYFLSPGVFRQKIENNEFLEWEEVYNGIFYGTLFSEVERIRNNGKTVVFDVDVVGGCKIKQHFGEEALAIFIQPPSVEELRNRLTNRSTDAPEVIETRVSKAAFELKFAPQFDVVIINDVLEKAFEDTKLVINSFINK
jgi:guanylate kinase